MIKSQLKFRVRYCEVDRMGYVHHSNYAAYFEMGRTELMRENGISYKQMEDDGIILPLSEFNVTFYKPGQYDDLLTLDTVLSGFSGVRLIFDYRVYNQENNLLAEGQTPLVFVNVKTGKPTRPPAEIKEKISLYFKN